MPGFNKTDPMGEAPMTGHRMGTCTNDDLNVKKKSPTETEKQDESIPENMRGRGLGRGRGRFGFGRRPGRMNRFRGGFQ